MPPPDRTRSRPLPSRASLYARPRPEMARQASRGRRRHRRLERRSRHAPRPLQNPRFFRAFPARGPHHREPAASTSPRDCLALVKPRWAKGFLGTGLSTSQDMRAPDAGDIALSKGPPMQSTPTLKDTDPHDVFAIESLLHAHAEKAPPLANEPATPPAAPQVHVAPPISVDTPTPQVEPTFSAPEPRDIPLENVRPSEIKVDGLKPLGEQPTSKSAKRVVMALLGLCGAMTAAAWQHYGDQAKAMASEWAPPF